MRNSTPHYLRGQIEESLTDSSIPWWQWDMPQNRVTFHDKKVTMLGYSPSEFENVGYQAFTNLLHPEDYERAMNAMRAYLDGTATIYQVDYRIQRKDGSYTWYLDRGYAIEKNDDGSPKVLRGLVFDLGIDNTADEYDDAVFRAVRSVMPAAVKPDNEHDPDLLTLCSVCLRLKLPDEEWFEITEELQDIIPEHVSHGICPDCIRVMYPEYERIKGREEQ